ncbi:MAG: gamma-glutamylcyclotransferase [Kofleriaceae bacterium]
MSGTWVFGYGSLVWRPSIPFLERRAARLDGWARRFWQASTDHRGTVAAPGRVLTLAPVAGAAVWGVAYRVAAAAWPAVERTLAHREQQGYDELEVTVALAAADRAGPAVAQAVARLYVARADNPYHVGPEPLAATAAVVARATGPSGPNRAYVDELARALAAMDAPDPEVTALAAAVARLG